jgi:hypothetical protein
MAAAEGQGHPRGDAVVTQIPDGHRELTTSRSTRPSIGSYRERRGTASTDRRDTWESSEARRSPATRPDLSCSLCAARGHCVSFPCGAWRWYCPTLAAFSSGRARGVEVSTHERIRDRPLRTSACPVGDGSGRACLGDGPPEPPPSADDTTCSGRWPHRVGAKWGRRLIAANAL